MCQKPSRIKTIINGKEYTIVGLKPQKHLQIVADVVTQELEELKRQTSKLDDERRAVLLAINAKSEQLELEQEVMRLKKAVKQATHQSKKL